MQHIKANLIGASLMEKVLLIFRMVDIIMVIFFKGMHMVMVFIFIQMDRSMKEIFEIQNLMEKDHLSMLIRG